MAKIRLVKGPHGGKTYDVPDAGRNEVIIRDKKRMTREQKYNAMMDYRTNYGFPDFSQNGCIPTIEARYRIAMRVHSNGGQLTNMPCMHPDGSYFYEYVEGTKREFR